MIAVAKRIGQLQAWLMLTAIYFLALAPIALVFRCVADPLRLRRSSHSSWHPKSQPNDRWKWAQAQ